MRELLEPVAYAYALTPGGAAVLAASVLVFWPLLGVWLFGGADVLRKQRGPFLIVLIALGSVLVLGPSVWQSTVGQMPDSNPGLVFVPMVLVFYGGPLMLVCCVVGLACAGAAWLAVGRAGRAGRNRLLFITRLVAFIGIGLFVPTMSLALSFGVGLAQVG